MLSRLVWGALVASAVAGPSAAESLNPEQARQFIAGKIFAFTCVDGTRGSGRIHHDGSVAGSIQFSGSGPIRYARLPVNTIQVGTTQVCASLKGLPFTPCFNLDKTSEGSFRGSVQGMELRLLRLPQARQFAADGARRARSGVAARARRPLRRCVEA